MRQTLVTIYMPIVALIASQNDQSVYLERISEYYGFGRFPEYADFQKIKDFRWRSHASSFSWTAGLFLEVCGELLKKE